MNYEYEHKTLESALAALDVAESDTRNDFGEQAVADAWTDLVRAIAHDCAPDVRAQLLRSQGLEERS